MKHFFENITHSFTDALPRAGKIAWWIIKIMLPLSLAVGLLQYFSILPYISNYLAPLFTLIGLSGDASIAFISSVFVSCYAPIAIISSLNLDMREIIILGAMCVISHNLIFECTVQKKTGSNPYLIFTIRLISSFIAAIFLNVVLPENASFNKAHFTQVYHAPKTIVDFFINWSISNGLLVIRIILIIFSLMFLQNILRNFNIIDWLSKTLAPVMKMMGLSANTSFLWLVGQIVGLAYGSAILIDEIKKGEITRSETTRLNYHLALNHSQLEDPMLFVAIGAPFFWVSLPRFILSVLLVWIIVLAQKIKYKNTAVQ